MFEQTVFKCQELVRSSRRAEEVPLQEQADRAWTGASSTCRSEHVPSWAKFRRTKGAIKLHLLSWVPRRRPAGAAFAVATEGKTSDIEAGAHAAGSRRARSWPSTVATSITSGLRELTQEEVYFVTRMKEKAVHEVEEESQVPQNSNVVRDQIISFPRLAREGEKAVLFQRVEIWDKEKEEAIVFLSNLLAFGATTIAAIYLRKLCGLHRRATHRTGGGLPQGARADIRTHCRPTRSALA